MKVRAGECNVKRSHRWPLMDESSQFAARQYRGHEPARGEFAQIHGVSTEAIA